MHHFSWWRLAWTLLLYGSILAVVGVVVGAPLLVLLVGALALVLWHYWQLFLLVRWLWDGRQFTPPRGSGTWQFAFDGVYFLQRKNLKRRKELGRLLKRFREGTEALPDAVVVINEEREIVWCNKLATHILGVRWPDDNGQRIDNLLRRPEFVAYIKKQQFQEPLIIPSPAQPMASVEVRVIPYTANETLMVARDVTRLQQLEQMRRDFVANVSHELRTPLTVLRGYLEMIGDDPRLDAGPWGKPHKMMTDQVGRMYSLVEQLLALSRLEARGETETPRDVDVPALMHKLESDSQALNSDKQHSIRFDIDNLHMQGDSEQMTSAFANLVANAIHYTPSGGNIEVSWKKLPDGRARFSVTDTGDGIAPEHILRITERFYRVDKARSRNTGGSGLGLSIVKHVLSRHRSRLEIRSTLGKGSTFWFDIPKDLVSGHQSVING
ncbi:MAG: phosphate regulon sensor histidine kinase PhoR [Pseudomonadota bacterium]|uniref:phosphate regulon sensor histidine kinase PhoR n=1 Tax=Gallaecimonas pentaromativorans TaxID=584787 RepID=UPI00067F0A38|nr:phosphate regulon sensor histidine kinase PhoR [Gallaecimonas pentaromativorans]MED5524701.1 phosphate regulon sensor histidine kinase PhoR [Pseudomonadota bacterium]